MEINTITIKIENKTVDFTLAKQIAVDVASDSVSDPMLIARYDGIKGEEYPTIPECQHKPGWLAYAEGHNTRLRIDINQDYSFIFTDSV